MMQELSMNILDVAQNSVKAGAHFCEISLREREGLLRLAICDDGCGMDEDTAKNAQDPFYTTRTTRKVGLGLPFLKMAAEQTGGQFRLASALGQGTCVSATFVLGHIDLMPLGDIGSTMATLSAGSPNMEFSFFYEKEDGSRYFYCSKALRDVLGEDVSFEEAAVFSFITDYINENLAEFLAE